MRQLRYLPRRYRLFLCFWQPWIVSSMWRLRLALSHIEQRRQLPADEINLLVELDRYIKATLQEQQGDEFEWHRQNILHEDDVSFNVRGLGTVYTYGKSFFDEDVYWKTNLIDKAGGNVSKWMLKLQPNVRPHTRMGIRSLQSYLIRKYQWQSLLIN